MSVTHPQLIERLDDAADSICRLILAGCIEPSSYLRRDGRALRYTPDKQPTVPIEEFERRAEMVLEDVHEYLDDTSVHAVVRHGDGRRLDGINGQLRADLALFSPPYPNNIDYTEVYKMEAWALGLIQTQDDFRRQRHRTVRSHPSFKWADAYAYEDHPRAGEIRNLLAPMLDAVPDSRDRDARKRLVRGYADDMLTTLMACRAHLGPGAPLVFVVANSLHGNDEATWLFAADIVIARLGELAGYTVDSIEVARRPARRRTGGRLLRESVVFMHAS